MIPAQSLVHPYSKQCRQQRQGVSNTETKSLNVAEPRRCGKGFKFWQNNPFNAVMIRLVAEFSGDPGSYCVCGMVTDNFCELLGV